MTSDVATGITSMNQLERKMHLKGKVLKTTKAGAIVDVGVEKPALLHVSQIVTDNKQPILRVEDTLKEGQEVDVYVRNVRDDRIEVSMIEPLQLEWREIDKDMVLKGKVVELEKFGAFVDIGAERPGLVHISELTQGYVKNASEVVSVGDEVEVKILDFNRRRKQIKLSMKALQPGLDEIEGVKITPAHTGRRIRGNRSRTRAYIHGNRHTRSNGKSRIGRAREIGQIQEGQKGFQRAGRHPFPNAQYPRLIF
jgi:predicted RNA-binding protein with RPS1 domain